MREALRDVNTLLLRKDNAGSIPDASTCVQAITRSGKVVLQLDYVLREVEPGEMGMSNRKSEQAVTGQGCKKSS